MTKRQCRAHWKSMKRRQRLKKHPAAVGYTVCATCDTRIPYSGVGRPYATCEYGCTP